jgi:hypothetical protein
MNAVRFPLLIVEFEGVASDEQFRDYLLGMDRHVERCAACAQRTVVVVDTLRATSPVSAAQRRLQAEWLAGNLERVQANMLGMVFVIDNVLVRGVLTAILWLQEMPCEHTVVGTREEAEKWAVAKLAAPTSEQGRVR